MSERSGYNSSVNFQVSILVVVLAVIRGAAEIFVSDKTVIPPGYILIHLSFYFQVYFGILALLKFSGVNGRTAVSAASAVIAAIALLPPAIDHSVHLFFATTDVRYRYLLDLFTGNVCNTWLVFFCPEQGMLWGTAIACFFGLMLLLIVAIVSGQSRRTTPFLFLGGYALLISTFALEPSAMNYIFKNVIRDQGLPHYGLLVPHVGFATLCIYYLEDASGRNLISRSLIASLPYGVLGWLGAAINRQSVITGTYAALTLILLGSAGGTFVRSLTWSSSDTAAPERSAKVSGVFIILACCTVVAYLGIAINSAILFVLFLASWLFQPTILWTDMNGTAARMIRFALLAGSASAGGMLWGAQPSDSTRLIWIVCLSLAWAIIGLLCFDASNREPVEDHTFISQHSTTTLKQAILSGLVVVCCGLLIFRITYGSMTFILMGMLLVTGIMPFIRSPLTRYFGTGTQILLVSGIALLAAMQFQHVL